jgi:hypothetical protein
MNYVELERRFDHRVGKSVLAGGGKVNFEA